MIPPTVSVDNVNAVADASPFGLVDPFNNILRLESPKCFGEEQEGAKCSIVSSPVAASGDPSTDKLW